MKKNLKGGGAHQTGEKPREIGGISDVVRIPQVGGREGVGIIQSFSQMELKIPSTENVFLFNLYGCSAQELLYTYLHTAGYMGSVSQKW